MKVLVDTHTHTIASDHAYSTVGELTALSSQKGLEAIAVTDHGPAIKDAPHIWHFENLSNLPRQINGVRVLYGVEANLMDDDGTIDIPEKTLMRLDLVICSIHTDCYPTKDKGSHTKAYINALKNPYVDILGHSGYPEYEYDIDQVLTVAKELDKLIEINAHTFSFRKRSTDNCIKIARRCKEMGVKIAVGSDAHCAWEVGNFTSALEVLAAIEFPESLIVNLTYERLAAYLKNRKPFVLQGMPL